MYWIAYKCFLYQEIDFFRHLLIVELSLPLYQKAVLSVLGMIILGTDFLAVCFNEKINYYWSYVKFNITCFYFAE